MKILLDECIDRRLAKDFEGHTTLTPPDPADRSQRSGDDGFGLTAASWTYIFDRYIGIDYSGAKTPTDSLKGLRVYLADRASSPVEILPSPRRTEKGTGYLRL